MTLESMTAAERVAAAERLTRESARTREVAAHILQGPRGRYYAAAIAKALNMRPSSVAQILVKLRRAGFLSHGLVRVDSAYRNYHQLTPGAAVALRRALKNHEKQAAAR